MNITIQPNPLVIGPALQVNSIAYEIDSNQYLIPHAYLSNQTGVTLYGVLVELQRWDAFSGMFVTSSLGDEYSFDEGTAEATWAANLHVKLNGVLQSAGWSATRNHGPDQVLFTFDAMTVAPDDVLHLGGYEIALAPGATENWRLNYQALIAPSAVPLPAAAPLFLAGFAGMTGLARRRRSTCRCLA